MDTPQAYEAAIRKAIQKKAVDVRDIFLVPDYCEILHACGDKKFSDYAKGKSTQHQFIFEAVNVTEDFPFGVKVTYRAYSRDTVNEIVKNDTSDWDDQEFCANGGNPLVTVQECHVETFPKGFVIDDVTVPEGTISLLFIHSLILYFPGMYLLQKLPDLNIEEIKFMKFKEGGRAEFDACLASVEGFYGVNSDTVKQWHQWRDDFVPVDDCVDTYVHQCDTVVIPEDSSISKDQKARLLK